MVRKRPKGDAVSSTQPLLDIQEAADLLGTSIRQVRSLVYRRELAYVKVGSKLRFDPDDIDAYIKTRRVIPVT